MVKPSAPWRMSFRGRTAVITGAAGGIGRAIAVSLARRGASLALSDIDEPGLAETARLAAEHGAVCSLHRLDVANRDAVAALPDAVMREHPGVDILVNNAGVALGGTFEQVSEQDFEWLFNINFWGVVRMTRAFLPELRRSGDGRLVNLSSLYGLIAPPGQTAYAASKFAVRGFSEALRRELAGSCVGVTVVHPGGVASAIVKNARMASALSSEQVEAGRKMAAQMLKLSPELAGEIIVQGVERRKSRVLVGSDAKVVSVLERLAPVSYWSVLERMRSRT